MSRTNIQYTGGGTQSPPLEDHEPMGVCSISGGNAGGIPDRLQRSQYFDSSELQEQGPAQPKAKAATKVEQPRGDMSTTIPEQQTNLGDLRPAHDPQPGAVLETAPTGPFKKMGNDDIRSARRA